MQTKSENIDAFTNIDFVYPSGVATVKVAKGAKAEGELVISGTKHFIEADNDPDIEYEHRSGED